MCSKRFALSLSGYQTTERMDPKKLEPPAGEEMLEALEVSQGRSLSSRETFTGQTLLGRFGNEIVVGIVHSWPGC